MWALLLIPVWMAAASYGFLECTKVLSEKAGYDWVFFAVLTGILQCAINMHAHNQLFLRHLSKIESHKGFVLFVFTLSAVCNILVLEVSGPVAISKYQSWYLLKETTQVPLNDFRTVSFSMSNVFFYSQNSHVNCSGPVTASFEYCECHSQKSETVSHSVTVFMCSQESVTVDIVALDSQAQTIEDLQSQDFLWWYQVPSLPVFGALYQLMMKRVPALQSVNYPGLLSDAQDTWCTAFYVYVAILVSGPTMLLLLLVKYRICVDPEHAETLISVEGAD